MDLENLEKNKKIIWCHWDLFRFFTEENLNKDTIIGLCSYETMKDTNKKVVLDFRIYLYKENEKFIIDIYTDEDNKDTFTFDNFEKAHTFMDSIEYNHPEYEERPMRIIDYENGNKVIKS